MPAQPQPSIFLVDDSDVVLARLRTMVQAAGWDVAGDARGVGEAIDGIRKHQPHTAILDLELLNGSGLDVLRRVRNELPALVVIVLTNHANEQYRAKCLAAGANHFLDKSYDFERIPALLAGGGALAAPGAFTPPAERKTDGASN
jgi:DNA-binding NarL/FixJ family response regulator